MKIQVISKIDVEGILSKRGMGSRYELAKVIASEVKRLSDPYVPMQQGILKNTAQVVDSGTGVAILYNQPYAHYQYYGEVMAGRAPKHYTGKDIDYHDASIRGKEWDKRMMADRKDDVVKAAAKFVGGKPK